MEWLNLILVWLGYNCTKSMGQILLIFLLNKGRQAQSAIQTAGVGLSKMDATGLAWLSLKSRGFLEENILRLVNGTHLEKITPSVLALHKHKLWADEVLQTVLDIRFDGKMLGK